MSIVTALAVLRRDHPADPGEQELASVERHASRALVVLDDGTTLDFDADELHAATAPGRADHIRTAA